MPMNLPTITDEPTHHANCCLSLSTILIDVLTKTLQQSIGNGLTLSVGSGSGLLEALLLAQWTDGASQSMRIEGVEVYSPTPVNLYLPEEAINIVAGTWGFPERITQSSALIFVYPRQPKLIQEYMNVMLRDVCPTTLIIWLGPRVDWVDYEPCFRHLPGFEAAEVIDNCGLVGYEMMAVLRKHPPR